MDSTRPEGFLEHLRPLLVASTGCVKSVKDMAKLVQQMKSVMFFPHKCICIQILKKTVAEANDLVEKFYASGGWAILNSWLTESKKTHNSALSIHLLELLRKLPVTVDMLKLGTVGKLVKQLSKAEQASELKSLAIEVLDDWMNLIKSSAKDDQGKGKAKGEKRTGAKVPEEPIEKRAKPANLYRLGTKDVPPASKPKTVQESLGFMTAVKNSAVFPAKRQIPRKIPLRPPSQAKAKEEKSTPEVEAKRLKDENEGDSLLEPEGPDDEKKTKKKRKSVSWAPDSKLKTIHTFELDETERVNVNRRKSFNDALQSERLRDRQILENAKLQSSEDLMEGAIAWSRPRDLHSFIQLVDPGANSKEKSIQAEREQQNLAFFFLSKESLQESPFEPDSEQTAFPASAPREIPLNESGSETLNVPQQRPPPPPPPPPSSWPESTAAAATTQSLLDAMKKSDFQRTQYRQPSPQHALFERAFDPKVQSKISTENLKQILQSTTQLAAATSIRPPPPPPPQQPAPMRYGSQSTRYPPPDSRTTGSGFVQQQQQRPTNDYQGPYRNQRTDYRQRPYDDYSRNVPMANNTRRSSGDDSWRR
ncbi:serine/threonine-protein phosphatase 1 regulatory subunit 10-like [Oscarella lobularis]|uniref:serine/threonine-protein phosphatase 1 regulatory subunit 10-like n=1 Tax=Oscarella lobularis TaxID=121494 RepID=UPI0033138340